METISSDRETHTSLVAREQERVDDGLSSQSPDDLRFRGDEERDATEKKVEEVGIIIV